MNCYDQTEFFCPSWDRMNIRDRDVTLSPFPWGTFDARVPAVARQAGYQRMFAAVPAQGGRLDLIGRIEVSSEDWLIEDQ